MSRRIDLSIDIKEVDKANELIIKHKELLSALEDNLKKLFEVNLHIGAEIKEPPEDGSK